MAVRFVLGPAGSGKTHRCLEGMRAAERVGRSAIYLVPEQFTYLADRELLLGTDLPGLRHTRVLSFSRLAATLEERVGSALWPTLDPATRPMVLRAALAEMSSEELGPLAPLASRPGFLSELARFVSEVRNHGVVDFESAVRTGGAGMPPAVSAKLAALGLAFDRYQTKLRALGRRDPEERLSELPRLIAADPAWWRETPVWVDGFLSWTRRERDALVSLGLAGATLEIALCIEPSPPCTAEAALRDARAPFVPIARSWARLESALARAGVPIDPPLTLETRPRFRSPTLARLESALCAPPARTEMETQPKTSALTLRRAADRRQEVQLWARQIDQWLRLDSEPVRPSEIALLLRDVEPYREAIAEVFPRYRIPFFLDEVRSVLAHPRARFLLGALEIPLSGWRREAVIAWLRSPLLGNAPATIDLLENYSMALGQDYEGWTATAWDASAAAPRVHAHAPAREDEEGSSDDEAPGMEEDLLAEADAAARKGLRLDCTEPTRLACLLPLRALEEEWGRGVNGAEAVALLEQRLRPLMRVEPTESEADRDWSRRVDEALRALLAEAASIWPDVQVSMEDFARTLREGLRALRLGVTPARIEDVSVGDIRRSRLQGIRRAIVGGLNDGAFPRTVPEGPVVSERDRAVLAELGAPLGPTAAEQQEEEVYLFYIALTRAADTLCLTLPSADGMGKPLFDSLLLAEVTRACPSVAMEPPPDLFALSTEECQTPEEIGGRLLSALAQDDAPDSRLRQAAPEEASPEWRLVEEELRRGRALWARASEPFLDADVVSELFPPEVLRSSVSRLESFARCPFQHFARSILKLEPREEAEISPLATGLLAHAVLEAVFKRAELPRPGQAEALVSEAMRGLEHHPDFLAFHLDPASRHRWDSVRHSLAQYLEIEAERLSRSRYRPHAFEIAFGPEEGNAVVLPLAGSARLELRGRLDRLDRAEIEGEARGLVIDYKSKGRKQVARHWREGRDLQLGVYLLFVDQVLGWKPAGGLYVPVLPSPISEENIGPNDNRIGLKFSGVVPLSEREAIDGGLNVLPTSRAADSLKESGALPELLDRAREHLTAYAGTLRRGWIEARPTETERKLPCDSCDYLAVCRHRPGRDPERRSPREGMDAPTALREEA